MRKVLIAAIAAVALLAGSAEADTALLGLGSSSCGTWTAARNGGNAWGYEQWVLGFLTGIGSAAPNIKALGGTLDPLRGTDYAGVLAWFDNYCRAHPLVDLGIAGWAFVMEHPGTGHAP
jgi:hypothetical protein